MKTLQDRVNIVPIIAKADTLTSPELAKFKKNVKLNLSVTGVVNFLDPPRFGIKSNKVVCFSGSRKHFG